MRAKGRAGNRQTMIENLVDVDRCQNDICTAGKPFHPIKKRGDAVCLLNNHAGQLSIIRTKIGLQQLSRPLDASKRGFYLMRQKRRHCRDRTCRPMKNRLSTQTFSKGAFLNGHQELSFSRAALAIGRDLHIDQLHADAWTGKFNALVGYRHLLRARP